MRTRFDWGYLDSFTEREYLRTETSLEVYYVWAIDEDDFYQCGIENKLTELGYIGGDERVSHERILFPTQMEINSFLRAILPDFPDNAINILFGFIYDRWHTFNVRNYLPKLELREKDYDFWRSADMYSDCYNRERFVYDGGWDIHHEWDSKKIATLKSIGFLGQSEKPSYERILFPSKREIMLFLSNLLSDFPLPVAGHIAEFVHHKMHTFSTHSLRTYLPTVKFVPKNEPEVVS